MGKKGSDIAPPDPRLVEAQLQSMGVQDEAIKRVMAIAEEQQAANRELMPLQKQSMQFGLDTAKTGWEQSQSDREWLLGRRGALTGLQDKLIGEANAFDSNAAQVHAADKAAADVGKSLSDTQAATTAQLASMGVRPDSGTAADTLRKTGVSGALAMAGGVNAARTAAREEGRALTYRASDALAGYPAMATGVTGQGAGIGASSIGIANSGAGGINAGYGAMTGAMQAAGGIAAQKGSNATGMYGAQATAYNQAQANQGEFLGSLLGAGATLGAAYLGMPKRP